MIHSTGKPRSPEKTCPGTTFFHHISQGLVEDRIWASAVRDRRLTAWPQLLITTKLDDLRLLPGFPAWLVAHRVNHNQSRVYLDRHVKSLTFLYNCNQNQYVTNFSRNPEYGSSRKPVRCELRCSTRTDGQTEGQDVHA